MTRAYIWVRVRGPSSEGATHLEQDRVDALLDAERENTALRTENSALKAEIERLRETVAFLRASVPPTRPTDYGHEVWTETARTAVDAERVAVVAWLHDEEYPILALAIERGEHRRKEEP